MPLLLARHKMLLVFITIPVLLAVRVVLLLPVTVHRVVVHWHTIRLTTTSSLFGFCKDVLIH
jgi:hypothetical protein